MPIGGYAPCPIRLGGDELSGLTAAQWKAYAADLVCVRCTTASAVFHVAKSGSTVTVSDYFGENGNGQDCAPVATVNGTGDVTLTFTPPIWENDFGKVQQIVIRNAKATPSTAARVSVAQVLSHSSIRVRTFNSSGGAAADSDFVVKLWFDHKVRVGDYAAYADKGDSKTEGKTPRAAALYRELQAMRGDAYSKERSGYIHLEHLAIARFLAWAFYRIPEEAVCNQNPVTSGSRLGYWAKVLAVPNRPQDREWEIRQRCIVKFKRTSGATSADIDNAIREQLGVHLSSIVRNYGASLDAPPGHTYWPDGDDPGPSDLDLGGGTWSSLRSHLFVVLSRSLLADRDHFNRVANSELFDLLDSILPVWATFSWYLEGNGFIIGESLIGYDAL